MNQKKVLKELIKALKEEGIIKYDKDFLEFVGVDSSVLTPKQLSDYLRREGEIRNKHFLKKVEDFFKLPSDIWNGSDSRQMALVKEAVKFAKRINELPSDNVLDLSEFIPSSSPATKEQIEAIQKFKSSPTLDAQNLIEEFLKQGFLEKTIENQEFLVGLIKASYDKGLYEIIVTLLLPKLLRKYRNLVEIQKIEAHSLGSLGEYSEAKYILTALVHHTTIENINLRTSALSNYKREILNREFSADELYLLIQGYKELHSLNGIYSYYTGINLLYMVILGQIRYPNDDRFFQFDTRAIYEYSKPSLRNDKTHESYYNTISNFEFMLLLGREGIKEQIEFFLDDQKPNPSLVERSLRQMKLFIKNSQNSEHPIVKKFIEVAKILDSYLKIN